jgi:hypothetical protein
MLNLYWCEIRYPFQEQGTGIRMEKASEQVAAANEGEARRLFFDIHRAGLTQRGLTEGDVLVKLEQVGVPFPAGLYVPVMQNAPD